MKQARCLVLFVVAFASIGAEELPTSPEPGSFEIEPPLLPGNLAPEEQPKAPADVAQLTRKLARAKQSAAGAERLFKMGVLAKVEVEARALRVIRVETELAQARAADAQSDLDAKKAELGAKKIAPAEVEAAQRTAAQLQEAAQLAVANLRKAELEAATVNLERQRKLFGLGSARKAEVRRAEEKLAHLQNAPP